MAKRTQLILLVVAILFALIAAWLVTGILNKVRQSKNQPMVSVVTVTQRLGAHVVVAQKDISVVKVPADAAPAGAVHSANKVVGQYTAGDWFVGQTVLADMVTNSQSDASFPLKVPPGERAYTLANDSVVGVDHLISPGDHVDVLVSYTKAPVNGKQQPVVKTVLQNVQVLYVDNAPAVTTTATVSSKSGSKSPTSGNVDTITLALNLQEAEELDYARTFGQVQLILRNPTDTSTSSVSPAVNYP